ncbi:hypothetical protein LFM09_16900 [Lentzea alba]|uniref:hypothetical protein n=1 Tax=Lentzea alba TaxID=2714351 RepID=UPI0039BF99BF
MRKFMIAVVAVGATVLPAPAAHAVPGCSAAHEEYNQVKQLGWGKSTCSEGIQRVRVTCHDMMGGVVYTIYGPWAGPNEASVAYCDPFGRALSAAASF